MIMLMIMVVLLGVVAEDDVADDIGLVAGLVGAIDHEVVFSFRSSLRDDDVMLVNMGILLSCNVGIGLLE